MNKISRNGIESEASYHSTKSSSTKSKILTTMILSNTS